MALVLYHFPPSAPSRAALLAAKVSGVDVDIQIIDLFKKEQLKPSFLNINSQHTVPTLTDGDFTLWDSHAIATYLAATYSKNNDLYPKDLKKRAIVDQRLQFNCGTLYPRIRAIFFPILFLGEDQIYDEQRNPLEEALGFLDVFLQDNMFVTGDSLTVADCALIASISTLQAVGWNLLPYKNVTAWIDRCSSCIPDYNEANLKGAEQFAKAVKKNLAPGQL